MGIIGVVAALTLPNLNSSTGEKEKIVKLQKIYSNLQDAFGRATAVYGPKDEWCTGLTSDACKKRIFDRMTEFMKISKVCSVSDPCALIEESSGPSRADYAAILADGAVLGFEYYGNVTRIYIDLDGTNKGPQRGGKDLFLLYITDDEIKYPNSYVKISKSMEKNNTDKSKTTAWILENKNMDYLKCDGLKFNTNTTCK